MSRTSRLLLGGLASILTITACGDQKTTSGTDAGVDTSIDAGPPPDTRTPETGLQIVDIEFPLDVTPNGRIVLMTQPSSAHGDTYFYDTVTKEPTFKTTVGDPGHDSAFAISANLRVSGSHEVPVKAGLFSEADGWMDLTSPFAEGCDNYVSGGLDISDDGSAFVGLFYDGCKGTQAFRWSDASGEGKVTMLEVLGEDPGDGVSSCSATSISGDGKIAAGWCQGPGARTPVMWTEDGHGTLMDNPNSGEVHALNSDGSVAVGVDNSEAFMWTKEAGLLKLPRPVSPIGDPLVGEFQTGRAKAMGADGKIIFGQYDQDLVWGTPGQAAVWTKGAGGRLLADVAKAAGINVPEGTMLMTVEGASADGTVVIGRAIYYADPLDPTVLPELKSYVLVLPITAYL